METSKEEQEILTSTSRTCRSCLEANLISEVKLARCSKCGYIFCIHFASNIDPQYCTECLSNVTLHKETITKTYESYNEENEVVTSYKRKARAIRLEGMDWLFAQRKITQMSDESLELAIEYHREILTGMLAERETRKNKFMHRYAACKVNGSGQVNVDTATSAETTVKKTKTISSTRAAATANAIMQAFLAQGMTIEQITAMIEKAKK